MEDIRPPRRPSARYPGRSDDAQTPVPRPIGLAAAPPPEVSRPAPPQARAKGRATIDIRFRLPKFVRSPLWRRLGRPLRSFRMRLALVVIAVVLLLTQFVPILEQHMSSPVYALGQGESLLAAKDSFLASKLKLNAKTGEYDYNADFSEVNATTDDESGGPQIKAVANQDPAKGLQVTDPISNTQFGMTPQFSVRQGKQDGNRIIYPLLDGTGWVVYTMQASGVKEDVILSHANGDTMTLRYKLDLDSQGLAARSQPDGSIAIYGSSSPVGGNVSTSDAKDAALLQKAREHAKKDKFLFDLPAPTVYGANHAVSRDVKAHYELKGETLTTVTTGLKQGHYPLDVDPAVTVVGSSDLFRDTNAESNIDLDATTGNISRGAVNGGVVTTSWTTNGNNLATARFLSGAAVYDDYAYVAGGAGAGSTTNLTAVEYAAISKVNSSIGTWSTTTALPAALSRFQLIAYNGYMYAVGGSVSNTTCASDSSNIYYNRIQSNGQLSATWTTNTATLPAGVCGLGAAIYNNTLYIAGGRTSSTTSSGVTTVAYASVNPDGSIGSFTTDDSTLPAARYDADLKIYNGNAYMVAGTLAGALTNTVLTATLAADGSVYGTAGAASWASTTSLITARSGLGGTMATVNDGYMYVEGGCSTLNTGTQVCTGIQADIEVAQINADGTLGSWSNIATSVASNSQVGGSLLFWRGTIYVFAGCSAMSASVAAQCTTTLNIQKYDTIATSGQVGPLHTSANTFTTARYEHAAAIVNGYLYVMGGCITVNATNGCQVSASGNANTTSTTYYAPVGANGVLGSFTLESHTGFNSAAGGLAAMGVAVYNNYIYLIGGYDYAAGAVNTVYYAQTLSTGGFSASGWQTTSTIAAAKYGMSSFAYRGYVYSIGGRSNAAHGTGCLTTSYVATVQRAQITVATGALGTWSTTSLTQLPEGRALAGAAVYNNYVYLAGGGTQANGGQDSDILYAKLNSDGTISGSWNTTTGIMTTDGTTALTLRRTDAYAMNGYLYITGGHNGNTGLTYGTIQIGKINMSTGNIDSNLSPSVTTITARWDGRGTFANGYLYVTGGCSTGGPPAACTVASNLTEYVEIYNAGNKGTGTWSNSSNVYTTDRTEAASVAYNGYIYVAGGCTSYTVASSACAAAGNYLNTVYYAPLNPDGSIGTWASGGTLGQALMDSCLVAVGGYLYNIGGADTTGTAVANVYYSQVNTATGAPGTWNSATNGIPARKGMSCATFNGHIYVTGGLGSGGGFNVTVQFSQDLSAGGDITSAWTNFTTGFTTGRYLHTSVIVGGYLYVMGGINSSTYLGDVQFIQLNPSTGNSTGSWAYGMDLPLPARQQAAVAANGYIYLIGGRTANTTCQATTWIASVNSTGTTSSWTQSATNFTTARFGAASAYYNGYYYNLGGDDCTNIITSNQIQYGGEQSQAMKGIFSKYADLNGDGNPQKLVIYLTNAVLNGVDIEKWQMYYISSREAANSWGASTVISPLVNQNAYSVSALDGSSTDQVVSRWFYLSFSIDMTQSFTFTDDTQPTVNQYGLHYSPPPSKRLIHGQDFRDQTHQGLDLNL